jgi:hypothetical protein
LGETKKEILMKWSYDLFGAEPIIRDEPVTDGTGSAGISAATINSGALMCSPITINAVDLGGAANAGAGYSLVLGYSATVNVSGTNAVGIILESPYAVSTTASSYGSTASGVYGKCIINPGAVYQVEQLMDASNDIAVVRNSTTTLESVAAGLLGHWVYFPLSQAGVKGSLRLLTAVSVTAGTLDTALTTTATSTADTFVLITPKHGCLPQLDTTARKCSSGTSAATPNCTKLVIVETYLDRDGGLEIMKPDVHRNINNLHNVKGGNGPKVYYNVAMKSHLYK